ncbi:MAG: hypothetical protein HY698_07440 [Deltaproteobacteria bacterium]|nr:hypothetical protein [Deltaproteobacteria bacterium]
MPRVSVLFLVGCLALACLGDKSKKSDEPALASYRAALAQVQGLEAGALEALFDAMGDRYVDDAVLLAALQAKALPQYRDFVASLAKLVPQRDDVRAFHDRLVALARSELSLLERLADAVERGNGTAILFLNQAQGRVQREMETLLAEFEALREKPGQRGQAVGQVQHER